jgi:hypothetical protein
MPNKISSQINLLDSNISNYHDDFWLVLAKGHTKVSPERTKRRVWLPQLSLKICVLIRAGQAVKLAPLGIVIFSA